MVADRLSEVLSQVQRDLLASWPEGPQLILRETGGNDSRGRVFHVALPDGAYWGEGLLAEYYAHGQHGLLEAVAAAAQDTIAEVLRQVWPTCHEHEMGLHPSQPFDAAEGVRPGDSSEPVWWCPFAPSHVVSAIGALPARPAGE